MSETIQTAIKYAIDKDFNPAQQRAYAVAVALEVIASRGGNLPSEFNYLSAYADQIQAALKVD